MFDNRRSKATFDLFKELGCLRDGGGRDNDVGRLDVDKMMARALDCVAAVCEAQRMCMEQKKPLKLREDGEVLTPEQQAARNKVFRAALNTVAKGMMLDGDKVDEPGDFTESLLRAFPDSSKLADGRNWLPMHWAVVADEDGKSEVTKADVMAMYETDLMMLRKHHLNDITSHEEYKQKFGFTPAHMLCGLEMTEKNMSLVRHFSTLDPRAFAVKAVDKSRGEHSFSVLHTACWSGNCSKALLQLLVQLDASQLKLITRRGAPLGLLCQSLEKLDERLFGCLVEADSSIEVVFDAITRCFVQHTFKNRVRWVAKLLEANPAVAKHRGDNGRTLAHEVCCYDSNGVSGGDCVDILKLILAQHQDALKEVDNFGMLPAHIAAEESPVRVLDFVLGEYPEAAAVVDKLCSKNLLHTAVVGWEEDKAAKARLLCARYPAMMLQRDRCGRTPLLLSCTQDAGDDATILLLCEAGGREAASTAIVDPTVNDVRSSADGHLPLHWVIWLKESTLVSEPLSAAADAFRLLLRLYPEAASTEGGTGSKKKTPYRLAVDNNLPAYYLRLLLRAAPDLDPAELRRLNWAERRVAMYVAFVGVAKTPSLLVRLRVANKDLVKHVVSFL